MQLQLFLHADALLVVIRTHQLLNVVTHKKILATIFFCMSYDHPMLTHSWCVKKFHAQKIFLKKFYGIKNFWSHQNLSNNYNYVVFEIRLFPFTRKRKGIFQSKRSCNFIYKYFDVNKSFSRWSLVRYSTSTLKHWTHHITSIAKVLATRMLS